MLLHPGLPDRADIAIDDENALSDSEGQACSWAAYEDPAAQPWRRHAADTERRTPSLSGGSGGTLASL